jgi:hypothetical protein
VREPEQLKEIQAAGEGDISNQAADEGANSFGPASYCIQSMQITPGPIRKFYTICSETFLHPNFLPHSGLFS